jgi:hypothetical protein
VYNTYWVYNTYDSYPSTDVSHISLTLICISVSILWPLLYYVQTCSANFALCKPVLYTGHFSVIFLSVFCVLIVTYPLFCLPKTYYRCFCPTKQTENPYYSHRLSQWITHIYNEQSHHLHVFAGMYPACVWGGRSFGDLHGGIPGPTRAQYTCHDPVKHASGTSAHKLPQLGHTMKFIVNFTLVTSQWIQSAIRISHFELHSVTVPCAILCASVPACSASWCVSPVAPPTRDLPGRWAGAKKILLCFSCKTEKLTPFSFSFSFCVLSVLVWIFVFSVVCDDTPVLSCTFVCTTLIGCTTLMTHILRLMSHTFC